MGFVERVAREGLDQFEYMLSFLLRITAFCRASEEDLFLFVHDGGDFFAHGLPERICCAQGVTPNPLHYQEHLVLIDDDAVSLF